MNIVLDKRCTIEAPVTAQGDYGEPITTWALLAPGVLHCKVLDDRPSKSEAVQQGLVISKNRATITIRYLATVTSACRITVRGATDRVFQIIGGPSELGRHEFHEVYCETTSS